MGRTQTIRGRRHRRQQKAALKFGGTAKPSHTRVAGRTGSIHSKQEPAKGRREPEAEE